METITVKGAINMEGATADEWAARRCEMGEYTGKRNSKYFVVSGGKLQIVVFSSVIVTDVVLEMAAGKSCDCTIKIAPCNDVIHDQIDFAEMFAKMEIIDAYITDANGERQ